MDTKKKTKIVITGNIKEFDNTNIPETDFVFTHQFQVIYHNLDTKNICWIEEQNGKKY